MIEHTMTPHIEGYYKTYGITHDMHIECSCGYVSPKSSGSDFDVLVQRHRQAVIEETLGLKFSTDAPVRTGASYGRTW